jgi:hypothetical protein
MSVSTGIQDKSCTPYALAQDKSCIPEPKMRVKNNWGYPVHTLAKIKWRSSIDFLIN